MIAPGWGSSHHGVICLWNSAVPGIHDDFRSRRVTGDCQTVLWGILEQEIGKADSEMPQFPLCLQPLKRDEVGKYHQFLNRYFLTG
jgi:hypothetical protein